MGAMTKQNVRIFTEDEIEIITNSYSTLIGNGGFGEVFRGVLDGDNDLVAVKRCKNLKKEFMEEARIHSQLSHKNVVRFIGYCIGESTLMLVTEYVSRGNLDQLLHCSDVPVPLDIRLGIAIGCAEALSHMHSMHLSGDEGLVYHGDIKPANILLDDSLTTKVSDFGLSRLLIGGITQYTTTLKGSLGYTDPVYLHTGCLTPKSDVYSFGVVLLELISRKRVKQEGSYLIQWFCERRSSSSGRGRDSGELFDAAIIADGSGNNAMRTLKALTKLASECLTLDICERPRMSDVAKRLLTLKRELKDSSSESVLATHTAWLKQDNKQGTGSGNSFMKSLRFFKQGSSGSNSRIISELGGKVRIFTAEEINEVTRSNNSEVLVGGGTSAAVYKGTLEDNKRVVVRKPLYKDTKESFINRGVVLSRIAHKNIINLLGCCLEAESPVFVYEYVAKGSLLDVLRRMQEEDFPLDARVRVAIKVAEALEFLHSPTTGIIGHGRVALSNILLDDNLVPKLADFSAAWKLIRKSETTAGHSDVVISASILEKVLCDDPSRYESVLMNMESDVYNFGGVLLALISRENNVSREESTDHNELIVKFTKAYERDRSSRALFDKCITAEEDISIFEEIGRLALRCTILKADEMPKRPTMKEAAEQLRALRRSWKKERATTRSSATSIQVLDVAAAAAGAAAVSSAQQQTIRLPNLMRHLYGYRRISVHDPVHV